MAFGDLQALFGDMGMIKQDLKDYGIAGIGAVGGIMLWNIAQNAANGALVKADKTPMLGTYQPAIFHAAEIIVGVVGGNYIARRFGQPRLGRGLAIGMTAAGLVGLASDFMPSIAAKIGFNFENKTVLPAAGTNGLGFFRQPQLPAVRTQAVNGAPVGVKRVAGLGAVLPQPNFAAALTAAV